MNENIVCCGKAEREPSIQGRPNSIKETLGDTSVILEKTLSVLRGGSAEKCVSDAPRPIGCVMDDLEAMEAMAYRVRRLAEELSIPFQG